MITHFPCYSGVYTCNVLRNVRVEICRIEHGFMKKKLELSVEESPQSRMEFTEQDWTVIEPASFVITTWLHIRKVSIHFKFSSQLVALLFYFKAQIIVNKTELLFAIVEKLYKSRGESAKYHKVIGTVSLSKNLRSRLTLRKKNPATDEFNGRRDTTVVEPLCHSRCLYFPMYNPGVLKSGDYHNLRLVFGKM